MKEKFQQMLEDIKKDLIFLANEVEHNIRQSIKAVEKHDVQLANQIIDKDADIDRKEVNIEDQVMALLALQQPVAIDLRFIVGGLKMTNDLERIGDHAVNIAQTVLQLDDQPYIKTLKEIPQMSEIACKMLHDSVSAFIHQDTDLARKVCKSDPEVDQFYERILTDTIEILKADPSKLVQGFATVRIARSLERVADLATNIGEDVVFMKEAKIIRHHFDE
jgi:phosphate transport system protein